MSRVTYKRKIISDKTRDDLIYLENEVDKITEDIFDIGITIKDDDVVYYIKDNKLETKIIYDDNIETLIKVYTIIKGVSL